VEEKDMTLEPEEDVEGHAVELGEQLGENVARQEEDDDVEAHKHHGLNAGVNEAVQAAREDDDDVEGHLNV
jgi:hypothetical protein